MTELRRLTSWQRAVSFTARAHRHQQRTDDTPYAAHPMRVALTVRHLFECDDEQALCIALLHDVLEDTTHDYDDLASEFGAQIAGAVACLTKDKRLEESQREQAFYRQIAAGAWQARLVKLADSYDNISDAAAGSGKSLEKAVEKGRHAIQAAGDDPRLNLAVQLLQELIDSVA